MNVNAIIARAGDYFIKETVDWCERERNGSTETLPSCEGHNTIHISKRTPNALVMELDEMCSEATDATRNFGSIGLSLD